MVCDMVESAVRHATEIIEPGRDGLADALVTRDDRVHSRTTTIGAAPCRNWSCQLSRRSTTTRPPEGSPAVREMRELVRYRDLVLLLVDQADQEPV